MTKRREKAGKKRSSDELVNINLRGVPVWLRQRIKVAAMKSGMGLAEYCVQTLEMETRGAENWKTLEQVRGEVRVESRRTTPVRAVGQTLGGGKVGVDDGIEGVGDEAGADSGDQASGADQAGNSAGRVQPGREGGDAADRNLDAAALQGRQPAKHQGYVRDGGVDSQRGKEAPQAYAGESKHDNLRDKAAIVPGLSGQPINMEPFRPDPNTSTCAIPFDPNEASAAAVILGESNSTHYAGGEGPHLLRDAKGNTAYCGGPGACEFCERGVPPSGDHHAEQVECIPWIGRNRDVDPFNPDDVKAWKERDRQAAAILEPPPQIEVNPAVFEYLEATREAVEKATGADPLAFSQVKIDPHAKSIAAHTARSHVLSSAEPKPRVVETAKEAAQAAVEMKKPPAAKKVTPKKRLCSFCEKPLERWSATMLRCTGCGRNEPV